MPSARTPVYFSRFAAGSGARSVGMVLPLSGLVVDLLVVVVVPGCGDG